MNIKCHCTTCKTQVVVELDKFIGQKSLICPKCKNPVGSAMIEEGWIYVLSNRSMHGQVKIGKTARPVIERVEELSSSTGVPTPFNIEAYFASYSLGSDEIAVHEALSQHRTAKNREFFTMTIALAIEKIRSVLPNSHEWVAEHNKIRPITHPVFKKKPALTSEELKKQNSGFNIGGFNCGPKCR